MQTNTRAVPSIRKLDDLDLRLIALLQTNGRASGEDLARELSLSRPAVRDRMRRLESMGVLLAYTVLVDWESLGYPILAFVNVRTTRGECEVHARDVMRLSNERVVVEECHRITGEWCLLAKVRAKSSRDLGDFIDAIRESPLVAATATTLALVTHSGPVKSPPLPR